MARKRLLLTRIRELADEKRDFGFETTLAGRSYVRVLSNMKKGGYRVQMFFLWLPSTDLAVARVAERVRRGGHHVAESDIRRRFASGILNLFRLYRPLADVLRLYDASGLPPRLIAAETESAIQIVDARLYNRAKEGI